MSTLVAPAADPTVVPTQPVRGGFRVLSALLWRRRWTAALVIALVANAVAAVLILAEREYTASARIAVTPQQDLVQSASPASYDDLLGTVADVAESRPLLEAVAAQISERSVDELRDEVDGEVVSGTVIVQVSVDDTDPELAAEIANLIISLLPNYDPSSGSFQYQVTEQAVVPEKFSSPNIPVTALAGLCLAIALAVAAAAIADRMFRTVTDPEEMAEVSETAVLGVVPRPDDPNGVSALDLWAEEFQSIRALRIALEFASAEDPTRVLVVTSAGGTDPWAGWIEVNLAAALAEVGHRVLVINADREGEVHQALEASGEPGLYDVLSGECLLGDAVRKGPVDLVDVLPLGHALLAAPSLLEMRFRGLVDDTEDDYDVVIVHTAPVSSSEDARIMAIHGAVLLTVPAGTVHPRFVRRAAEHVRGIRLRVLGTVLLGVKTSRRQRRTRTAV
ncbi:polysaccharide biosynthesis tyrosine autokinase [Nocardioides stalactiti]|uniref:polysaccharide biosynthesis tyrosine autokinase n=1 Tax=Nocardioides stalactiti TaxID=2755356 RepID=UPI0015FF9EC0|nr:polysaccharide biosynthesis tyrosine autokinase [Nocardioides stalactiti]